MKVSCDRCLDCLENGDSFCRYCGERLTPLPRSGCDRCEECKENGDVFCKYCGKRLIKEEHPLLKIGFYVGLCTASLLTMLLVFEYIVALWGIPMVFPKLPDYGSTLIVVTPYIVNVVSFNGVLSQIYYILLILAVTVCISVYIYRSIGSAGKLLNGDDKSIRNTAFYEVCVLFSVLFFWEMTFILILEAMGVEINDLPERDTWVWMYELLEASVWEEIITRMLLIGVPVFLVSVLLKHEGRASVKFLFGGVGFNRFTILLIFFSAFIFGAAHLNNWGLWKFFPTFAFGLIAGYLFCKYGVYATILLHFMTDYMSAESWLMGTETSIMTVLLFILVSLACIPFTYVYLKSGVSAMCGTFSGQSNDLK